MIQKRLPPDDPREWLNRARGNIARAVVPPTEGYLEDACFDAQQAAEKAIKAIFVSRDERFPYIHDLEKLLGILRRNGLSIPKYALQVAKLSRYAAETRYPGATAPVSLRDYRHAVRIATAVLRWAERQVDAALKESGKKS